ncbi:hypothetical protein [Myroides pelagicus]|uniref:Uncharacterized protein n=1 Tax=Myroides pelagicus TaxID=270914 RepID=A0A7K1GMT8_9FLAO|nr:hypothetical protein [Myroides pelagicus]MEC4113947.1 hypothetical protein [Myroides pelagicus]MTH30215.1 hypothetical protein [Myroides pelagicus]
MKQRLLSITMFTLLMGLWLGCQDKKETVPSSNTSENTVVTINQPVDDQLMASTEETTGVEEYIDPDNPTIYPNTFRFAHHMIMLGEFHAGELTDKIAQKQWIGLVKESSDTYSLVPIRPKTKLVYDVVLDNEGETTATSVSVDGEEVVFMIEDELVISKDIVTVATIPTIIYPGETIKFNYRGKNYSLHAEGEKEQPYTYENEEGIIQTGYTITKYNLYLKVQGQDDKITLLMLDRLEDATPTIEFAGDLNDDGIIDLLINTTYNYNMYRPTLYLSKVNGDRTDIVPVAAITSLGC